MRIRARTSTASILALATGCMAASGPGSGGTGAGSGAGGKEDSGWLSDTSFEVDAHVHSWVAHAPEGEWASLASDRELQTTLIDLQLKYAKNGTEAHDYRANQLFDDVEILDVRDDGGLVMIEYRAVVDMIAPLQAGQDAPTLDELDPRSFEVQLPLDPVDVYAASGGAGATDAHASDYNYAYYWKPELDGCDIEKVPASVEIVEVLSRPVVFPEYDQLMRDLGDGTTGFRAALVPARGDDDPRSRFDAHRAMLEEDLGLTAEPASEGVSRYRWREGEVQIVIDLFDPTVHEFSSSYRGALSEYQLVFYNGHSAYGTQQLLTDPEAFAPDYQILMLHSCQSYAYFVQQALRAKATADDPEGEATVDFVATGRSSYPTDSAITLRALLRGLMDGLVAIAERRAQEAPDWISVVSVMNRQVNGILYGVAGVRTNSWHP